MLLAASVAVVAGCTGDDPVKPPVPTSVVVTPATGPGEQQSAPIPVLTTAPPPTEQPVATTIPIGLPASLGLLPADTITIGAGSSTSISLTVRGVPLEEVQAFVVAELADLGWAVSEPVDEPDGDRRVPFVGPGAEGNAVLAAASPDLVEIHIVLGPRPS